MTDQEPQAQAQPQPIFDLDIECPYCQYNLRGLVEPRCPECGNAFDPPELLDPRKSQRPAGPSLIWAVPRMLAHPVTFWSNPQVHHSHGPNWGLLYLFLAACVFLGTIAFDMPQTIWEQQVRIEPIARGLAALASNILPMAETCPVYSVLPFAVCVLHGVLCRIALRGAHVKDPEGAAKALIAYSAVWILPVAPAYAASVFWLRHLTPVFHVGWWPHAVGAPSLLALVILVALWARTLYEGGRLISGGSPSCGLWCALVNPFWYIGVLVMCLN